ncbi:Uncharacterised protein [uncultured Clostridium sp.]|uniref:hypothetical protein n=1 Tax=uncultured Clostridium sp. TaxID=59620 RepID=UPI0008217D22|nr:hypothetical protein [uncultured Clostridium sp.]SCJ99047.1 Uncharacterised protein [uncultured Clostridium sp.]
MSNNLNDELILAREILEYVRNKKLKKSKDYEAIIDLTYFISIVKGNKETVASKEIFEKIRSGYYDEVYKIKRDKVTADNNCNLKLSEDNMQYSFF